MERRTGEHLEAQVTPSFSHQTDGGRAQCRAGDSSAWIAELPKLFRCRASVRGRADGSSDALGRRIVGPAFSAVRALRVVRAFSGDTNI